MIVAGTPTKIITTSVLIGIPGEYTKIILVIVFSVGITFFKILEKHQHYTNKFDTSEKPHFKNLLYYWVSFF